MRKARGHVCDGFAVTERLRRKSPQIQCHRDQRAACFISRAARRPIPLDDARSTPQTARSSRAGIRIGPQERRCFRLALVVVAPASGLLSFRSVHSAFRLHAAISRPKRFLPFASCAAKFRGAAEAEAQLDDHLAQAE